MTNPAEAISDTCEDEDPGAREAPDRGCRSCGAPLPWAQVSGGASGCWFAICPCGVPAAHFPLRPEDEPSDPIAAAFGPARAPHRPPWISLFQITSSYPWWLPWWQVARGCPGCRQRVTFSVWTRVEGGRSAYSELCLACGRAKSEYLWPRNGMREAPVWGSEWTPPCVAVARLRRAVFSPQSV